ncbi:MAG: FimB/Mfa2 family fimbrial subunit [Prevotella sp.]|nr:FimB/Mfa2 family fimbrial subunit [Prevotella sp.]MBR1388295.1 FimB/Mfa2 family fimbrial subunit [Prevotella sp.]
MKNKHFGLLGAIVFGVVLLVASCEKMNLGGRSGDADDGEANVVVRVMSFEQMPFSAATRANIEDVCNHLNFVVFDENGERVDQKNQELGDEGFGEGRFTLPLGNYRLAIVAHSSNGNPSVNKRTASKHESISFTNAKGYTDTFFASKALTVGDSAINLEMNLRRVVAKVRFVNEDAVPEKADSIRIYYEGGSGSIDAQSGYGNVKSKQAAWFDKSETPLEIYTIPWQDDAYLEATIGTFQGGDLLTSTVIDSIPIRRNCITTCRGNIFDGKVTKVSFTITVDDSWGEPLGYDIPPKN